MFHFWNVGRLFADLQQLTPVMVTVDYHRAYYNAVEAAVSSTIDHQLEGVEFIYRSIIQKTNKKWGGSGTYLPVGST